MTDEQIIEYAKAKGWYWGEADFGQYGKREGWCNGQFAKDGFAVDLIHLLTLIKPPLYIPPPCIDVDRFHRVFMEITGRPVELDYMKNQMWHVWHSYCKHEPFTEQDLRLTVAFLKREIAKGNRRKGCLKFDNLISSPDWFQESLIDARAESRIPTPNHAKDSALRATGRTGSQVQSEAKSAATILNESKALAEFRKMKEEL